MNEDSDRAVTDGGAETFDEKRAQALELLEGEGLRAFHVGVVRGDEVDTLFAQQADDPQEEGLQALSLLASHVRLVAQEAGVDPSIVAADAASLAENVQEIPSTVDAVEELDDDGADED